MKRMSSHSLWKPLWKCVRVEEPSAHFHTRHGSVRVLSKADPEGYCRILFDDTDEDVKLDRPIARSAACGKEDAETGVESVELTPDSDGVRDREAGVNETVLESSGADSAAYPERALPLRGLECRHSKE